MPEERDIEKKLRAVAAKRRQAAGGDFMLHPATRRLLQGEVARTRPATESARRKMFFGLTWLRFASGICAVGVLCFGAWVWLRDATPPARLAQAPMASPAQEKIPADKLEVAAFNQSGDAPSASAAPREQATPPPAPVVAAAPKPAPVTPAPAVQVARRTDDAFLRKSKADKEQVAARLERPKEATVLVAENLPANAAAADTDGAPERGRFAVAGANVSGPATRSLVKSLPETPAVAFAATEKRDQTTTQNFAYRNEPLSGNDLRLSSGAREAAPAKPKSAQAKLRATPLPGAVTTPTVLARFNISQRGDRIRIEDSDGSVYEGVLLAENSFADTAAPGADRRANEARRAFDSVPHSEPASTSGLAAAKKMETTGRIGGSAEATELFAGVRFNATGTNVALRQNVVITGAFVNGAARQTAGSNRAALVPQSRIVGRAVTADGREIQLNAAPVGQ